jgi:Zn-dependent protease/CBS domain-containing protein
VHWSVLVIFGIIAVGLAGTRLPDAYPGHSTTVYWAIGLFTAVVFLASLLAHELAHAVLARRNGVDVDDIVLWLLGGVARLKGEAPNPGAELRIAGIGPLVSLILGGVFTGIAWLLHLGSAPGLLVEVPAWLAAINILLAAFNAIPAAPLDGGRLLHAVLWWRSGDRLRATAGAANAGRVFGWLLVAVGFYLFVRGDGIGGLWFALIGWFLVGAATIEAQQAQIRGVLRDIPVRNAMTTEPITVDAELPVAELLEPRYQHTSFPVTQGTESGTLVGLVTLDAAKHVPGPSRAYVPVRQVMLPLANVTVVSPDDRLADLLPQLAPGPEHHVLVVSDGRLLGILSPSDIQRLVTWLHATDPRRRR